MSENATQKNNQGATQAPQNGQQQERRGRSDQPRVSRYGDPRKSQSQRASGGKKQGRGNQRNERARPEFDQKILSIRRVTRVVAGGRRFSFSVTMATGDRKGSIGVGIGKASDVALAIEKALSDAKKNMVKLRLTDTGSIPYDVEAKYCASRVSLRPAPGKGVVAGSAVRVLLDLAGVKDVSGKIESRSKNHLNNSRAALKALAPFSTLRRVRENQEQVESKNNKRREGPQRAREAPARKEQQT